MATKGSKRVMDQRRRDYDRISFVVDKDAKHLIRAQALREGVSSAEMIRRAILARCGLENTPNFASPHYNAVISAQDKESATRAIEGLQLDEYVEARTKSPRKQLDLDSDLYMTVMLSSQGMQEEYIKSLLDLLDAIEATKPVFADPVKIKFPKKNMAVLRRLLANIEELPEDYYDEDV